MDIFRSSKIWCDSDMRALNAVRLHLQVETLSDIVTADGLIIDTNFFQAIPSTTRKSTLNWIRQPTISDDQQQLWQKALKLLLNTHSRLVKPLGTWHSEPNQQWTTTTTNLPTLFYRIYTPPILGNSFVPIHMVTILCQQIVFSTMIRILLTVMSHILLSWFQWTPHQTNTTPASPSSIDARQKTVGYQLTRKLHTSRVYPNPANDYFRLVESDVQEQTTNSTLC
jgi:hypothetical protein